MDAAMNRPEAPSVDVLMLAFNVAPWIDEAVEGVFAQRADFPIRLIIAEDGSSDATPVICTRISARYGDQVLYLPGGTNVGIARRTVLGLGACTAKYVAICDSDDRWLDPSKLAVQVAFLETHPDHDLSYSDVHIVDRRGQPLARDKYDGVRADYRSGHVFAKLLQGNFINNSTAVVRRRALVALKPNACRDDLIGDHLRWLQLAMRTRVHFHPHRTTAYRQGGVTSQDVQARNGRVMRSLLGELIRDHARAGTPTSLQDRRILARKILGVLARPGTALRIKLALLLPLFRYLPAMITGASKSGKE